MRVLTMFENSAVSGGIRVVEVSAKDAPSALYPLAGGVSLGAIGVLSLERI